MYEFRIYDHYEYAKTGSQLIFMKLNQLLTAQQKVDILQRINTEGYGCTDAETTDWALEYELWTRNLLCDNALPINPAHLDMCKEMVDMICEILGCNSENAAQYRSYVNNTFCIKIMLDAYVNDPDSDCCNLNMKDGQRRENGGKGQKNG